MLLSSRARRNAQQRAILSSSPLLLERLDTWLPKNHVWWIRRVLKGEGFAKHANRRSLYSSWLPSRRWLCHYKTSSYNGNIIEGIGDLWNGQIVGITAEKGDQVMKDPVLRMLARVPASALATDPSPISQSDYLLLTLFSMKMFNHLAIGVYATSVVGGAEMSEEELKLQD